MENLAVNEFRRQVGEYLNQTYYAKKAFILLKGDRRMAAVVPMAMLERLNDLEAMFQTHSIADVGEMNTAEQLNLESKIDLNLSN